jgi:hypothetical protein
MQLAGYILAGIYLVICIIIINIPLRKIDKKSNSSVVNKTKGFFKAFSISIFGALVNILLILYLTTYEYTIYLAILAIIILIFGFWLRIFTERKNLGGQIIFFALMLFFTTLIALLLKSTADSGGIL